jgi:uncharacterized coiled-coil DUF342 family protein
VSKKEKIEELNSRLAELMKEKERLETEADEFMDKRNKLNDQFNNIRAEVSQLREERDESNSRVKELKLTRAELKNDIHELIEELKSLRDSAKTIARTKPQQNSTVLQKDLDSLEWKIQTSSLSLEDEKQLIDQVRKLEAPLAIYKKLDRLQAKISEKEAKLQSLDNEQKTVHNQITQIAQKRQETHEKMLKQIEEARRMKTKADEAHAQFILAREKGKPVKDSIGEIRDQIGRLKGEIREEESEKRQQNEGVVRENIEKKAREKLKRGEKLSWEEFQVVAEKGLGAQD